MANIILQKTSRHFDIKLFDNDAVTLDGSLVPGAVVSEIDGTKRVSLDGDSILQVNAVPELCRVKVTREEGWQGNLGFKVELLDITPDESPGSLALAVYHNANAKNYHYTTGAFVFNATSGFWGAVCPSGFEPGDLDIHMGMLYAALSLGSWTLMQGSDVREFSTGGDFV